ncbi:MAG: PTS sugar transporter subunit IIB [Chloroflexi bacterium]|nr:PTS sugar transporter subunit IIB [Chloroflexota bacterium]
MSKVVMHRIDDRLIHGQVITGWMGLRGANAIWIVDDVVANTPMMLDIFRFAAPSGVRLEAMTVDQASERLQHLDQGNDKIMFLVKFPKTFIRLLEKGYKPEDINYGAMAHKANSKNVAPNCDLTAEEIADTEALYKSGIRIWIQLVPFGGQREVDWSNVRGKLGFK